MPRITVNSGGAAAASHHHHSSSVDEESDDERDKGFLHFRREIDDTPLLEFLATPPQPETVKWRIAVFMHTRRFESAIGGLLVLNALFLGYELDRDNTLTKVISSVFLTLFTVEIGIRWCVLGRLFFLRETNSLDLFIITFGVISEIVQILMHNGPGALVTIFRLFRLVRLYRIFTSLKDLRLLICSFMNALSKVFWVLVLLFISIYIASLLVRVFIGQNTSFQNAKLSSGISVMDLFGSVPRSGITMFQIMTLDSWTSQIGRPIAELSMWTYPFFVIYTLFAAFGILNLLTAVFVDALLEASEARKTEDEKLRFKTKVAGISQIKELFASLDEDGTGCLSQEEIAAGNAALLEDQWSGLFVQIGMPPQKFGKLLKYFAVMEAEAGGEDDGVSYQEFLDYFAGMDPQFLKSGIWEVLASLEHAQAENMVIRKENQELQSTVNGMETMLKAVCVHLGVPFEQSSGKELEPTAPSPVPQAQNDVLTSDKLLHDYFARYDLDNSGLIDGEQELEQLVTNLVFKLNLSCRLSILTEIVKNRAKTIRDNPLDPASFQAWFESEIMRHTSPGVQ